MDTSTNLCRDIVDIGAEYETTTTTDWRRQKRRDDARSDMTSTPPLQQPFSRNSWYGADPRWCGCVGRISDGSSSTKCSFSASGTNLPVAGMNPRLQAAPVRSQLHSVDESMMMRRQKPTLRYFSCNDDRD